MSPNLTFSLNIEPHTLMWNGTPVSISGSCTLLPDNQVRYLHRRVVATKIWDRHRTPIYGRVVGQAYLANSTKSSFWLVECEDTRKIYRTRKPQVIE